MTCLSCRNLNGCDLLVGPKNTFLADNVIWDGGPDCSVWSPIGVEELGARQKAVEIAGIGAVRGIHHLSSLLEHLDNPDSTEGGLNEMTDLSSIIKENMTRADRQEQLLYLTDQDGTILLDQDGEKTPRGGLPLRQYATDPEGPLGESAGRIIGWTAEQLLDAILDAEEAAGMILPDEKKRKTRTKKKKEDPMPTILSRKANAPQVEPESQPEVQTPTKVAKPATGGRRSLLTKAAPAQQDNAVELPSKVQDSPVPTDMVEQVAQRVVALLLPVLREETNKLKHDIDYFRERTALNLTTLHDVVVTTCVNPEVLSDETLLIPAGGNIEEYLEQE